MAIGGDRYGPVRRQAILHHLGIEGRRIYEDLPVVSLGMGEGQPTNAFEMSMQMLDIQFTPKTNLVLECHKFISRMQKADEDIASYGETLRGLALSCRFEQLSDSLIRDQIVRCTFGKKIREKLLMKDPSLEEAIQIAKRMEHTAVWLQEMDESNRGKQSIIGEIRNKGNFSIDVEKKKSMKNWEDMDGEKQKKLGWREIKCYRCGAPGNIASSKMCAARSAICRNYGKRGHFPKVCKLKVNEGVERTTQEIQDVCESIEAIILTVDGELDNCEVNNRITHLQLSNEQVRMESTDSLEKAHAQILLNNGSIKLLVDSGSLFTLISNKVNEEQWTNSKNE
ncbi:hypothetical protein NDU88_007726 [Pleurodeles waltl]|uniref:Retrotransposon gag domain-containing protein n=1 Tax=Pleurodeles waltl TaxID=8319 RepID=A0AAV7PQT9_PLEWA|nr:hypothetical protein NDU88_007726 [Pleurodeles waltl]